MSRLDKFDKSVDGHKLPIMKIDFYETIKHITKLFKIPLLQGYYFL